jgi:glutathionyl-hydroquinone reductase
MTEERNIENVPYNPYNRKLTHNDEAEIIKMMEANPVLDRLIAETIVLMPPEDLAEIIEKHKSKELKDPWENGKFEAVIKNGIIEPEKTVGFTIQECNEEE